uniref:Uncharacterized protein n=1 Tax=Anguilla anguilla TaxID=7936 RepID=A0A0E9WKJ8_ANGAN
MFLVPSFYISKETKTKRSFQSLGSICMVLSLGLGKDKTAHVIKKQ